jgi:hypothetical protein
VQRFSEAHVVNAAGSLRRRYLATIIRTARSHQRAAAYNSLVSGSDALLRECASSQSFETTHRSGCGQPDPAHCLRRLLAHPLQDHQTFSHSAARCCMTRLDRGETAQCTRDLESCSLRASSSEQARRYSSTACRRHATRWGPRAAISVHDAACSSQPGAHCSSSRMD